MPHQPPKNLREFSALLEVMRTLAGPDGCPWDKEQTHETLVPYLVEESYEVVEAIEKKRGASELTEELGDLLLQIVFHSELGRQRGEFDISDVIYSVNDKMIRRHPHVFSTATAQTADEVKKNWDQIKKQEKSQTSEPELLGGPLGAPALQRSHKIGEKTRRHSFDWSNSEEVWNKLEEEISELRTSIDDSVPSEVEHELGDVLFTVAQLARHLKIDPEAALRKANRRFESRFFKMQALAKAKNLPWDKLSNDEKESLWREIKQK